jgi:Trypsin-like serine proteases, typically periplasmic, contain C-terminal PDZ domain
MTKSLYEPNKQERIIKTVSYENDVQYPDFTFAAENSVDGVVFVKVISHGGRESISILDQIFGYGSPYSLPRKSVNSGSGVIISEDGYIVTNNHVINGANEISITTNDERTYNARIIGTDPVTDIALLKIDANNLHHLNFGDSDSLRIGEWVLAIGSPYDLRNTITAGIVSAKGRSLPDYSGEFKIESFIQTDAAVNPGNSGGALVNKSGKVVGINTAIASNTGSYTGYSFAVPSAIVKKVITDIKNFGKVQRAMLGISMVPINNKIAESVNISPGTNGVFVASVVRNGAAYLGGIRPGDVVVDIDGREIKTPSDIQERINGYKPGDIIKIFVLRNGKRQCFDIELKEREERI